MRPSSFPRSGVLVLGQNSIQSLLPSTLISQAESLLDAHKIQDAIDLADQQRKKLESKITVDVGDAEELRYVYQRIGFQCLSETLFEDAGKNLFAGDLDPRLLVSYFPDLRGHLFGEEDGIDLFEGVVEHMPPEASVDEIIRNYSPHLAPNTREAPPTVELRAISNGEARNMLEVFLRKWRTRRRVEDTPNVRGEMVKEVGEKQVQGKEGQVIDTVLAKIFILGDKPTDLHALLQDPSNEVILDEIEQVLIESGHFSILCNLYKEKGEVVKLCEAWAKLIEGEWTDPDVLDPLSNMFTLLTEKRDKALTQRWVIWLTKKDPDRALKLLTQRDSNKRQAKSQVEDDLAMLEQLQATNPTAAVQFLEFLVLQRRSTDRSLHMQLALSCVDQLLECLDDEGTLKLWRAKAASYASSASSRSQSPTPFLTYFASTTPDSPAKRIRLKTALYLQGSETYDVAKVREHLQKGMGENEKVLALELAILDGKLGNHRTAILTLVHVLRDTVSAEAYCTHGGRVISPKASLALVEKYSLAGWAGQSSGKMEVVDEQTKRDLVRLLLEVYMSEGESYHTARLLDSQAMNLDVVDVIPLVPPDWSLNVLSSFLARSFRRTLHAHHEGQIVKAMSSGQNLEVIDKTWLILREQGAIIEEAADDSDGEEDIDEKSAEKSAFQTSVEGQETVLSTHPEKMALHQGLGSEVIGVPGSGLDLS